ncbi:hypothetical protein CW751_08885 [Brumimicrobium salinarum]|uniref:Lipid/polyisoprenoid-binding YceI-like domain-containing protein n=1 Tax=Brumimicrobium salinarum TaxID=2058658 RepID=A0A2I0R1N7_9FLAO|nr:YceI family protein [Brumimicrobium salinarum]PKR80482.1 hypothetical protein CW751_08885 [Brumimicrobium salinarum]
MTYIAAIFLIISGVLSTFSSVKRKAPATQMISSFILGLITLILAKDFFSVAEETNFLMAFILISILGISFAFGILLKHKSNNIFVLIPLILSFSFLFFPQVSAHSFMDFPIEDLKVLIMIAAISSLTPLLISLVNSLIKRLVNKISPIKWETQDQYLLYNAFGFVFIGLIAAIGNFLLGKAGVLIAATFFLSSAFLFKNKTINSTNINTATGGSLFLIVGAFIILNNAGYEALNLSNGEVLEGIFFAGFNIMVYEILIRLAKRSSGKWQLLFTLKALFVPAVIILLLGFAYTQLERLGGVLTLTALLISTGLVGLLYAGFKNTSNAIGLKLFSFGLILIVAPIFSPVKQTSGIDLGALGIEDNKGKSKTTVKSYHDQLEEPNGKDLEQALGKWKIDEEVSKIFFELGPQGGRTNGEFQKVKGTFNVAQNISKSKIKVVMPVKNITTFNSMRDESLMENDYLNEKEHPEMIFKANQFKPKNDGYEVQGDFTLLGVTKPLNLTLKLVGVGEKNNEKIMVLWGKASLNRTDYGMASSAKIGDIVDFHFEVQLKQ